MIFEKIKETLKSYIYKSADYRLIVYVIALTVIGINVISSATDDISVVYKQIAGLILGVILMCVFALIKYDFLARYYWLMYIITLALLIIVLTGLGYSGSTGASRWIYIAGFQFQPSELAKIMLLIFFSAFFEKYKEYINSWKFLALTAFLMFVPWFLIFREPDLSTSVVTLLMFCVIIFLSEITVKTILKLLAVIVPAIIVIIALIIVLPADKNIISQYQYERIATFIYGEDEEDEDDLSYQQDNSVIAIASGGLTGKGLHNNSVTSVKNAEYISVPESDFIFTIVGEELGFIGSVCVLFLLALIIFECFWIGYKARDNIGRSVAVGFGSLLGFQSFINLGVACGILPNTGLTLPFVSAGLSSLVVLYIVVGIVLNISIKRKTVYR